MLISNSFRPPLLLRSAHIQTILASSKFRARGNNPMCETAQEMIIETADGIRLLGFYSAQNTGPAKGHVILLHGWEGSVESTYMLRTGKTLFQNGYNIFRLNFRDHGDSQHLNKGIFYAVLLDEVIEGVKQAAGLAGDLPVFLVGFSLGGNFVLRILRKCSDHSHAIENLRHAVSISPVLDPQKSTTRIDQYPIIRSYFLKKWRRSLTKKQLLYPDVYDFNDVFLHETLQAVTDILLSRYSRYASSRDYFKAYSVLGHAIEHITVPTTIITAADDPIIPVEDFPELHLNDITNIAIQPYGGHNGFLKGISLESWYELQMVELFDGIVQRG
jgi:predicted alpha/beta-fold hydrolase